MISQPGGDFEVHKASYNYYGISLPVAAKILPAQTVDHYDKLFTLAKNQIEVSKIHDRVVKYYGVKPVESSRPGFYRDIVLLMEY